MPEPAVHTDANYHAVRFYESDRALARIVGAFLHEGFRQGDPGILVSTPGSCSEILRDLTDRSCDVAALQRSNRFVLIDAKQMLSAFMVNGKPDPRKFKAEMWEVLESVCRGRPNCTVRIFGQMVDVLWQEGERDAAIRLEMLWNQLARTAAFSLLCGYAIGNFYKDAGVEDKSAGVQDIFRQHSHIVAADGKAEPVAAAASDKHRRGVSRREGR